MESERTPRPLVRRRERPRARQLQERLLASATGLFYRFGIAAVSVDEIVRAAGVAKPALYRYFASKEHLVAACVQADAHRALDGLSKALADGGPGPLDAVRAVARYFCDEISAGRPYGLLAVHAACAAHDADGARLEVARTVLAELTRVVTPIAGHRSGLVAQHLLLLILGAGAASRIVGPRVGQDMLNAAVQQLFTTPNAAQPVSPDQGLNKRRARKPPGAPVVIS